MDDEPTLDAAAGLASLASSSLAASAKGKPQAPRKAATAAPPKKKQLTPEQRAVQSAKRKDRRHAQDRKLEAAAALSAAAQQEKTNARVASATRQALLYLGLDPGQHGLVGAVMAAASTSSSAQLWPRPAPARRCSLGRYWQSHRACLPRSRFQASMSTRKPPASPVPARCWMVISGEKFKAQYAALKARGGAEAVEEHGEGEKPRPRGKTNSKKEDKRYAASIALHATLEGMLTRKDTRDEKRRQDKEEQMNAFMEIQRRRLELDAEKQAKLLEMEAAKQAKMLEIEAANAKTKTKEVALASMMTGVEIMKVDLNTVSPRKRPWFEKMQADMLKFDDE